MGKVLKVQFQLFRKALKIKNWRLLLELTTVASAIFILLKLLLVSIGHYQGVCLAVLTMAIVTPLSSFQLDGMPLGQKQMETFFEGVPKRSMELYFRLRKLILAEIFVFYLLFSIKHYSLFLFFLACVNTFFLVNFLIGKGLPINIRTMVQTGLKYALVILAYFTAKGAMPVDLPEIAKGREMLFAGVTLLCFSATFILLKNGSKQHAAVHNSSLKLPFIKNRDILCLFRSGKIIEYVLIIVVTFLITDQKNLLTESMMYVVFINNLLMYFDLLKSEEGHIQLFYSSDQLKKIRVDKMKSTVEFSLLYVVMMVIIVLLHRAEATFFIGYIAATVAFIAVALLVPINIEKKTSKQMYIRGDVIKTVFFSFVVMEGINVGVHYFI